jgi:glycosyltransferase involved in cell wall biosynthesis
MACGLPIISSNLSFNDDILDNSNSIRIDPNNVDEISNAIYTLYKDIGVRTSLGKMALRKSKDLSIENRIKKIIDFLFGQ